MNKEERRKEAIKLAQNPKIKKSVENFFKTLGKVKSLKGFSISCGDKELVSLSREDIDRVNRNSKKRGRK